jgi:RecA-family ATPase
VSKSFLEIILGIGAATGQTVLKHFKPAGPLKVLGLFAEDPEGELHRRVHRTVKAVFPEMDRETMEALFENLHLKSVMGWIRRLMKLEHGNPERSEYFDWLKATIEAHEKLDLLILDPKSRFYGLDENSNDHNTAWIACLEEFSRDYGLTILFSHHVSKQSGGALSQSSARGGSALVDACRWVANLKTMHEKTAEKVKIEDFNSFVEFEVTKSNYAPRLPATLYFKRSEHGILVPINLQFQRLREKVEMLCSSLQAERKDGKTFTKQELLYRPCGKEVREQMECKRKVLADALEYAIKEGWISTASLSNVEGAGRPKGILFVERSPAGG